MEFLVLKIHFLDYINWLKEEPLVFIWWNDLILLVGTGLNTKKGFDVLVAKQVADLTGLPFVTGKKNLNDLSELINSCKQGTVDCIII